MSDRNLEGLTENLADEWDKLTSAEKGRLLVGRPALYEAVVDVAALITVRRQVLEMHRRAAERRRDFWCRLWPFGCRASTDDAEEKVA